MTPVRNLGIRHIDSRIKTASISELYIIKTFCKFCLVSHLGVMLVYICAVPATT